MNPSVDSESSKRKRLSHACNHCRRRKTRCDEQQPCRTCGQAGVECVTTDKRRDGAPVAQRRRTGGTVSASTDITPVSPNPPNGGLPSTISTHDRPRLLSQCWGRERWRTGRLPMMPRLPGGSMLELTTEWLDLAFYRLKVRRISSVPPVINDHFSTLSFDSAPDLPSTSETRSLINSYFATFHGIFPIIDSDSVEHICGLYPVPSRGPLSSHQDANPCQVALIYLIVTAGMMAMPASEEYREKIASYIRYCNSLLGHLVAARRLESVQAVVLFAIVLRCCDKLSWAWDILTMGVSMAQSIGINHTDSKSAKPGSGISKKEGNDERTWWCMYVFEKILAFESGRLSQIWDRDLFRAQKDLQPDVLMQDSDHAFKEASIGLADVLYEIQERSARAWRREEWLPQSVEEAIEEKLRTGGELAMLLENWKDSLPIDFRPRGAPISGLQRNSQAAFLSLYYHTATIHLHRSALLVDKDELTDVINKYSTGKPWRQRLLDTPMMVTEAARDLVRLLVMLADSSEPNLLSTLVSPFSAVGVLAVHIIRERHSLLIRSDHELMKVATQLTRKFYHKYDTVCNIDILLKGLEEWTLSCLDGPAPASNEGYIAGTAPSFLPESLSPFQETTIASWDPTSLDWASWDWNDLGYLFEHGE